MFIDRSYLKKLPELATIFTQKQYDSSRIATGFLQENQRIEGPELTVSIESRNAYVMDESIWDDVDSVVDNNNISPMNLESLQSEEEFLGPKWAAVKALFGYSKGAVLQEALGPLIEDDTFDLDKKDDTFKEMDKRIGSDIQFLITGHTHLRRALKREHGEGYYFNTGTWVRLLKLDREVLESESKMEEIHKLFTANDIKEIDKSDHLLKSRTVASIIKQDNNVVGRLWNVKLDKHNKLEDDKFSVEFKV